MSSLTLSNSVSLTSKLPYERTCINISFPNKNDCQPKAAEQMVGTGRFELPTSRLSVVRSNQLSYAPVAVANHLSLSLRKEIRWAAAGNMPTLCFSLERR